MATGRIGGRALDLAKSYCDTELWRSLLTPFCSARPMPRFPTREFPRSLSLFPPHPVESSQCAGTRHPNSLPSTSVGESQALGRRRLSPGAFQPLHVPLTPPMPPRDAPWSVGPALPLLAVSPGARPGHSPWHASGPWVGLLCGSPPLPFPFINPCCRASHAHSGGPSGRSREICAMHCSHHSDGLRFYLLI